MASITPKTMAKRAREQGMRRRTPSSSSSLGVGDVVVYASHGIGRIESTHDAEGALPERIALFFDSGLKVTLPLDRQHSPVQERFSNRTSIAVADMYDPTRLPIQRGSAAARASPGRISPDS